MAKIYAVVILLISVCANHLGATPQSVHQQVWVDSILNNMSLDEKIGQLFMIAAYSNKNENYENELEAQIKKYHIGGIIFFQGEPTRQVKLTNRLQKASKYPLMIGMDAENGIGWRLKTAMEFPKMLTVGAIQTDSLIYNLGATIASHCRELGVHINFAPVVDINSNPANPVIGTRSFGECRENVVRKAILYMEGSLSKNVLPVIKHFPGHGDTDKDSHLTLPVIRHTQERLDSIELYPYRALIKAGVPAIMVSHLNVTALDSCRVPSSLSYPIVHHLLRDSMHFDGLCFTDAMNMKGVINTEKPGEAEIKALVAGNDVLLFPANPPKAIQEIKKAVTQGRLTEALITEKCRKILIMKYNYVLPCLPIETKNLWRKINTPENLALKYELYKNAITLIKNNQDFIPLQRIDTLKIASLNFGGKNINNFQTMLGKYTQMENFSLNKNLTGEQISSWRKKLKKYNCVIIYNHSALNSPDQNFGKSSSLSQLIDSLTDKRIILCHPAIPYGLTDYVNKPIDAIIVSYDKHLYAQEYAAQAIFGGISITGKLPVSIHSTYPSGYGLTTRKVRLGYATPEMCGMSSEPLSQIANICTKAIRMKATPGCQVLIAKNGYIVYNKAFGYHTYQKQNPNNTSNIYDLASITKITATLPAVMKLYDEHKIELEMPLSNYYSSLKNTDKKKITVKEVLCHNSGLKSFIPLFINAIDKKSIPGTLFSSVKSQQHPTRLKNKLYMNTNYKFLDSTLSNTSKPGYKYTAPGIYMFPGYQDTILNSILNSHLSPRKDYTYSDLGFIFLKYAVEEITGKNLNQYCQETFYKKLGMNNTSFLPARYLDKTRIIPSNIDKAYRKTTLRGSVHDPTAALLGGIAGHAGLFSNAEDLAKILQMYLNQGMYGGEHYLAPSTIETFTCKNKAFPKNRRGLGFDKPEPDTRKTSPVCKCTPLSSYGHTGFTGTMTWCDPENQLIYIFLSNRTYPDEYNTKLTQENIRTRIQEQIYQSIKN